MRHTPRPRRAAGRAFGLLAAALVLGCAHRTLEPSSAIVPGIAPRLAVEQFLRAANDNDLVTMGRLFGTRNGSVAERDDRKEVEQRMFALASLLRHQDYEIQGQSVVPGRIGEAVRINVRLQLADGAPVVPFTVVQSKKGAWLVEQIDINALNGR
ncbi:MAG: hypothetical protein IRZ00_09990 [Gemmatimonadetes bacterium]|nr:hypothetical protein [Gemmatimonadota bacterium]